MEGGAAGAGASSNHVADPDTNDAPHTGDEDEVAEVDPEGRYYRYTEVVGRGRFKQIYKAFDTQIGIDVAWSKITAEPHHLSDEQLQQIVGEMTKGLDLEHPNIIKCFECWEDQQRHCINLITELFTSGNLRQYRNLHKHLDLKAVKRMARQILKGLEYLHAMQPPVVHGDLRCDKIYVNGHSGEIKIGDLGLATLIPLRWEESEQDPTPEMEDMQKDVRGDIFAFGLCMLELLTLKQLDPQHCLEVPQLLTQVPDAEAARFIANCVGDPQQRHTASQLLDDPFLQVRKAPPPEPTAGGGPSEAAAGEGEGGDSSNAGEGQIAIGKLRGEDYNFEFQGKAREGKMHFRLFMTQVSANIGGWAWVGVKFTVGLAEFIVGGGIQGTAQEGKMHFRLFMTQVNDSSADGANPPVVRTIDFVFDPDVDTADNLAAEISEEFALSPTDTEICAAALREWLAKDMPGSDSNQ
ncbi:hypothetical protein OEZ85_009324 [Tetradesmus obliquus]|uniref:non-specific serine/threonine protein kinase n=1 Tax=Tetradesmus obliquus TaxID=3088 RepID=A0ABY8U8X7_TETOB|nr:hypothetical protein OEZ85_009324 [Tetradesmus obliquus]